MNTAGRIGVTLAAVVPLAAAVALLWPRPPPVGPCLEVVGTAQVEAWRKREVTVAVAPQRVAASRVCRATWSDGRNADRTVLALSLHHAPNGPPDRARPGAEVEVIERDGTSVQVIRPMPGRALLVIGLDEQAWAEVTVEDEQQGDVAYWVDRVLAQRRVALGAIARAKPTARP